jgi:hypothetical protein
MTTPLLVKERPARRGGRRPGAGRPRVLTEDQVAAALQRIAAGETVCAAARILGIDRRTLSHALRRLEPTSTIDEDAGRIDDPEAKVRATYPFIPADLWDAFRRDQEMFVEIRLRDMTEDEALDWLDEQREKLLDREEEEERIDWRTAWRYRDGEDDEPSPVHENDSCQY